MAEYIEREALKEHMKGLPTWTMVAKADGVYQKVTNYPEGMFNCDDVIISIDNAPAADVVEVVRCKDCKHKFDRKIFGNIMCGRTAIIKNGVPYGLIATGDNHFCSYGERKNSLPEDIKQTVLDSFMKDSDS